ncbi:MAG: hypothetical protein AAGB48_05920 [Planctomycetota bacterium]
MIDLVITLGQAAGSTPTVQPWFSQQMAGIWGGAVGGGVYGGLLIGCGGGAVCGPLAQAGRARGFVMGYMLAMVVLAIGFVLAATVALLTGQPYHVWYPFMLMGAIGLSVCVPGVFMFRSRYAIAEQRKLEAAAVRSA